MLHELGHITGLGHTSEPQQLMYPDASEQTGTTAFQAGDLAGMKYLGRDAGCIQTPTPAPVAQGGQGGGGGRQPGRTTTTATTP